MSSIRSKTLALVLALFALISGAIFLISLHDASHEVEELFDARLVQSARMLQGLMRVEGGDADSRARIHAAFAEALSQSGDSPAPGQDAQGDDGHPYESKLSFQVWQHGVLVMRTGSAPAQPLSATGSGFADEWIGDQRWRVFVLRDEREDLQVMVGEREDVRGELVDGIVWQTMMPDVIGVPLLALLIWLAIGWGLQPLERMARLIRTRDPSNLQPLDLVPLPDELAPMQQALNRLLGEVARLMAAEKRFIADAAHELRTPLTVLRLHAHNALQAADVAEREEALRQLGEGVERTTRLASQLLTLARLEPDSATIVRQPVDLLVETRQALAALTALAQASGVELVLEFDEDEGADWALMLEPGAVEMLLQNLVGNAVRYSPPGSMVEVVLAARPDALCLRVVDHGCGVPADARARLGERFLRLGAGGGAGLGLSIVRRVLERQGGGLAFDETPGGGLSVALRLVRDATRGRPPCMPKR
jgi:two-component system, OmpR family, sensor histidine kinase QseC